MADATISLWFLSCIVGLWLGFRLSNSMHEGAADSRAPTAARMLVTAYCTAITVIMIEIALGSDLSAVMSSCLVVIAVATGVMQLLQIWTEKPTPGKDCQGRDIVE